MCAETVKAEAFRCKHCGHTFSAAARIGLGGTIVLVFVLIYVLSHLG